MLVCGIGDPVKCFLLIASYPSAWRRTGTVVTRSYPPRSHETKRIQRLSTHMHCPPCRRLLHNVALSPVIKIVVSGWVSERVTTSHYPLLLREWVSRWVGINVTDTKTVPFVHGLPPPDKSMPSNRSSKQNSFILLFSLIAAATTTRTVHSSLSSLLLLLLLHVMFALAVSAITVSSTTKSIGTSTCPWRPLQIGSPA